MNDVNPKRRRFGVVAIVVALFATLFATPLTGGVASADPSRSGIPFIDDKLGPGQPTSGPGGAEYSFDCVEATYRQPEGRLGWAYWIFSPACAKSAAADSAPRSVVGFLHGVGLTDPAAYRLWIDHLARRGSTVVFPVYQSGIFDIHTSDNAAYALRRAFEELQAPGAPTLDMSSFTLIGHSAGGGLVLNLAAMAADGAIPKPSGVFFVEGASNTPRGRMGEPNALGFIRDWRRIDPATHVTFLVGDYDDFVSDETAWTAWQKVDHLNEGNRRYVILRSDWKQPWSLIANHLVPLSFPDLWLPNLFDVNSYDFLLWAIADELVTCGSTQSPEGCPTPTSLPNWTWWDGSPVRPAELVTDGLPERLPYNNGVEATYAFYPVFEALSGICPFLGDFCGTKPPAD